MGFRDAPYIELLHTSADPSVVRPTPGSVKTISTLEAPVTLIWKVVSTGVPRTDVGKRINISSSPSDGAGRVRLPVAAKVAS